MNRTIVLLVFALLIITGCKQEKKDETPSTSDVESLVVWPEKEKDRFYSNCVGFLEREGVASAENYCDCLLASSMEKYPDIEEAMELEQTEIVNLFEQSNCLDDYLMVKIEDPWTEEVSAVFLEHCQKSKTESGSNEDDALKYCSCALDKIKELIPQPQHLIQLTPEEWESIVKDCQ
jgi:hypothetical protein